MVALPWHCPGCWFLQMRKISVQKRLSPAAVPRAYRTHSVRETRFTVPSETMSPQASVTERNALWSTSESSENKNSKSQARMTIINTKSAPMCSLLRKTECAWLLFSPPPRWSTVQAAFLNPSGEVLMSGKEVTNWRSFSGSTLTVYSNLHFLSSYALVTLEISRGNVPCHA